MSVSYEALRSVLSKPVYAGLSHSAAALSLNAQTELALIQRTLTESGILGLLGNGISPQEFAAVFDHATFPLFKADIVNQNHAGVALWAGAYHARGLLSIAARDAIIDYSTSAVQTATSPAERIGWPVVTEHDVAHARSLS